MEITNVGYNYRHPANFCIDRQHGSGDYILLIIRTEAFFVLGGERVIAPPNSAVVFKKGTPQFYGATRDGYVNDWIHFEMDESEELAISALGLQFDTVIPLYEATDLSDFIKRIFWERYSQNLYKEETMRRYFELIILKLAEKTNAENPAREHPYYHLFCTLRNDIRLLPQSDWSIDEICKRMNLSRSYVQHLYKSFFCVSIVSDVQGSRMEHAKYLLSATNMTVSGIAQACGYESDVHFMRIFKRVTGMTPSGFRNEFQVAPNEVRESKSKRPFCI
ncbi:MAG: helix-turn-helix transcriptional regulator [Clostridia bacterium]|nr:helix-turn-helix transcriptional regulator [Clostridia bacterium]